MVMVSQLIIGLHLTAYGAKTGSETDQAPPWHGSYPQFFSATHHADPNSAIHDMRSQALGAAVFL